MSKKGFLRKDISIFPDPLCVVCGRSSLSEGGASPIIPESGFLRAVFFFVVCSPIAVRGVVVRYAPSPAVADPLKIRYSQLLRAQADINARFFQSLQDAGPGGASGDAPQLLAPLLYAGERVTLLQWAGAGALAAAVFLFSPRGGTGKKITAKTVLLFALCAVSSAGCAVSQKLFVTYAAGSVTCFNLIGFAVVFLVFGIAFPIVSHRERGVSAAPAEGGAQAPESGAAAHAAKAAEKFPPRIWIFLAAATAMLYANQYFAATASGYFSSAVFYPLTYAISMPLTFLADTFIFRERVRAKKIVGILCAVAAVFFVNL